MVQYQGRQSACKVSELEDAVRAVCTYCTDFTSRLADISVGSVGSPDGFSTIITRSKKGEALFALLEGNEEAPVELQEIRKLSSMKRKKGSRTLEAEFCPPAEESP
jgi:coenzyme F420 hydrogenase subunit beta